MRQITRLLDLVEFLASHGDASLAELADALALPRASVHRLLAALGERGYVEHDPAGHVYRLGPAVRSLASRSTESALVRLAAPALSQLRAQTGETLNLAIVTGSRIVYGATLDGLHLPRMSAIVGQEVEPHATALGKALLSVLSPEARAALLPDPPYAAYTPATITDPDTLEAELATAAKRGYATDIQERTLGAVCVATPIVDAAGRPVGAISISGVPERLPVKVHSAIATELREWCTRIQAQLSLPEDLESVA
jgi:IclR family transcriptional regulator, acetate operon repressor